MNCNLALVFILAAVATSALAADNAQPAAANRPSGCKLLVGNNAKDIATGNQVCWRHPEYLTCTTSGNFVPKFCPNGQKCEETGGRVSCVPDPFAFDPNFGPNLFGGLQSAPVDAAASQNSPAGAAAPVANNAPMAGPNDRK